MKEPEIFFRFGLFGVYTGGLAFTTRAVVLLSVGYPVPLWQIVANIVITTIVGLMVLLALFVFGDRHDDDDAGGEEEAPTPMALEALWRR